jgi:hypothetical protein
MLLVFPASKELCARREHSFALLPTRPAAQPHIIESCVQVTTKSFALITFITEA